MLNNNKLKQLRKANGWTYTQMLSHLAKEQGVYCSPSSLSGYENGRTKNCPPHLLFALAALYSVEPQELLINL